MNNVEIKKQITFNYSDDMSEYQKRLFELLMYMGDDAFTTVTAMCDLMFTIDDLKHPASCKDTLENFYRIYTRRW